jgi:hypothetical protein
VLPWALAAVGLAGEVVGVAGSMVPTYTGHADGWQALARLAWLQPAGLGTLTLAFALVAETTTVAFLMLVFLDEARSQHAPASLLLRGSHARAAGVGIGEGADGRRPTP